MLLLPRGETASAERPQRVNGKALFRWVECAQLFPFPVGGRQTKRLSVPFLSLFAEPATHAWLHPWRATFYSKRGPLAFVPQGALSWALGQDSRDLLCLLDLL